MTPRRAVGNGGGRPFTVFLVADEESGDALGAELIGALADRLGDGVRFVGLGGERMAAAGLNAIRAAPLAGLHGLSAVLVRLPSLIQRIRRTAEAVIEADPDVLVIIDAPAFNLRVAKRVRRTNPAIAVVEYVSPTVWAYFPSRARRIAPYVDQILAIFPFEPAVHRELGGPPCTFVGHPLLQRLDDLRPGPGERPALTGSGAPVLLVLPGSRRGEISRLMGPFGATLALLRARIGPFEAVLPAVPRLAEEIRAAAAEWPVRPRIVVGEAAKFAAFRRAHAALAASGTVTLELALSRVPMVVAYRLDRVARLFKWLVKVRSIVMANIIIDQNVIPEFIDGDSSPERLYEALAPLLEDSRERRRQISAFGRVEQLMAVDGDTPSGHAADLVIETVRRRRLSAALQRR